MRRQVVRGRNVVGTNCKGTNCKGRIIGGQSVRRRHEWSPILRIFIHIDKETLADMKNQSD